LWKKGKETKAKKKSQTALTQARYEKKKEDTNIYGGDTLTKKKNRGFFQKLVS